MSEPSREEVEAAAKALHNEMRWHEDPDWESTADAGRNYTIGLATKIVEAAAKVRQKGERVLYTSIGEGPVTLVNGKGFPLGQDTLKDGDRVVIRPSGGKEQGNG